jgi:hypothetical protein
MRKTNGLLFKQIKKLVFTPFMFLLGVSCGKELSLEGLPHSRTIGIFSNQIPSDITANDSTGGIELGLRFRSAVAGYAKGIRFYKTPGNTGTHTGQLYAADGTLLASQVFVNETDTGWQSVLFEPAIPITANTTYIAAYHSSLGNYTATSYGLYTAITNGPLTALADSTDGANGLFKYTDTPALPDRSYNSNNYWVDIMEEVSGD